MGEAALAPLPRPLVAVPVPLAPQRMRERGFNQAEEIFAPWLAAHGIALRPMLVRTRETAPLYERTRTERQRELRGAFALAVDADPAGRDVLLVDDIMTTGTTLTACAQVLRVNICDVCRRRRGNLLVKNTEKPYNKRVLL